MAMLLVAMLWAAALLAVSASVVLFMERTGQANPPGPGATTPEIVLEPELGQPGSLVTVRGQGWESGRTVLVYLLATGETIPSYAVASAVVDPEGGLPPALFSPLSRVGTTSS
jgi:hypothetical protein